MPEAKSTLKLKARSKTQRHQIVIYMGFETLLEKTNELKGVIAKQAHNHKPMSYGLFLKPTEDVPTEILEKFNSSDKPLIFRGNGK